MVIKVLGTGCSKCKALYAAVEKVVKENGINAELIKEEDLEKIKKERERESSQMYSYLPSNIWFKHDK